PQALPNLLGMHPGPPLRPLCLDVGLGGLFDRQGLGRDDARLAPRHDRLKTVLDLFSRSLVEFARLLERNARIRTQPHRAPPAVDLKAIDPRAVAVPGDLQIQSVTIAIDPALRGRLDPLVA